MMVKGIILIGSLIVTITIATIWVSNIGGTSAQNRDTTDHEAVAQALRRGGLREAAKLKGHYVGEVDPHWDFSQLDSELLTKNSAAVIVGVVTKKLGSRLTADEDQILTDYEVLVQETIKGEAVPSGIITVSIIGGRVVFEDGTSAELRIPTVEPLKAGDTYTLFLSESTTSPNVYTLTGGPQGLVEIVDNTTVKSYGRSTDPIAQESKDKDKDTFLRNVRKQAEKWPPPGRCCH